jgi:hypothetical protein
MEPAMLAIDEIGGLGGGEHVRVERVDRERERGTRWDFDWCGVARMGKLVMHPLIPCH